ncbi:MAG: nucleotide sugar dehydrogenase [Armatimonadetes bacterium]|nr:nucleotide sugar dehydrogenase [Armatimonadota bacterium]
MKEKIKNLIVRADFTVRDAMKKIDQAGKLGLVSGIAAVVDGKMHLLGIVTDGDIRRAVVDNISLDTHVKEIMNKDPIVFSSALNYQQILNEIFAQIDGFSQKSLEKIILVNKDNQLEDILDFYQLWKFQNSKALKIAVIGMGYVGLPLAIIFAEAGFLTYGIEKSQDIIERLRQGQPHFYEKGLTSLLQYQVKNKILKIYNNLKEINADVYIISVGTPLGKNMQPDLTHLISAAKMIGGKLKENDLVILRSTVPVGTTLQRVLPILENVSGLKGGKDFFLSFAPERTVEGEAILEIKTLPQIIGGLDNISLDKTVNLFRHICNSIITLDSLEEAELVKLINNCYRDLTFSFANEVALLCENLNIDAFKCIQAASKGYPRGIIPIPSPGVGGTCLKKDPYLYAYGLKKSGFISRLALISREINEFMPVYLTDKIILTLKEMKKDFKNCKVFIVGFAYKGYPETSDTRDSSTLVLLERLKTKIKNISGHDPMVNAKALIGYGVKPVNLTDGFKDSDAVIFMNNHPMYSGIDILKYVQTMKKPALFCDFWSIFSADEILSIEKIIYMGLGFTRRVNAEKTNK